MKLYTTSDDASKRHDQNPVRTRKAPAFERFLTVKEVAQVLGTSEMTIRRMIQGRKIEFQRVSPRRIVISESALRAYLDRVTVPDEPWAS